jgi:hypothetical protein
MHGSKPSREKVYPTYRPYPVSSGSEGEVYSPSPWSESGKTPSQSGKEAPLQDFPDLISDPFSPEWLGARPVTSNDEKTFRPLHLLGSLFADRLDFLNRALDELQDAKQERESLTKNALENLDSDIRECERSLDLIVRERVLDDPNYRCQAQRRLLELKRERRREALLSWRDLVWLKGEIRKLRREIDSLGRTARPAQNGETQK